MTQSNEQGGNGRTEVGKILNKTFDWGREWERLGYDGTQPTSGWTINDGVEAILEWHNQDRKQHELEARINERNIEYQELLKEYRFTAHNSGFGRQLSTNMAKTQKRIAELKAEREAL